MENLQTFWDQIINSSSIVNSATIFSVVLALIFFIYQEVRQRRQRNKDSMRIKDEIVNLIIRNHVNSDVPISRIDLISLVQGFELLKESKLNYKLEEILQIVYAKVYENEHIKNEIRMGFLKELEDINNGDYLEKINVIDNSGDNYSLIPTISTAIVMFLFVIVISKAEQIQSTYEGNLWISILSITIPAIIILTSKRFFDEHFKNFIKRLSDIFVIAAETKDKDFKNDDMELTSKVTINGIKVGVSSSSKSVKSVNFNELFDNADKLIEIIKDRIIIEYILRNMYVTVFEEETRMPVFRITSALVSREVLDKELSYNIRKVYTAGSYAIHEGKLPEDSLPLNELLHMMKFTVASLYELWELLKKENTQTDS